MWHPPAYDPQQAQQYPQYSSEIMKAARQSFVDGANWAYTAWIVAIVLGGVLVWFMFPKRDAEQEMLAGYAAEDSEPAAAA